MGGTEEGIVWGDKKARYSRASGRNQVLDGTYEVRRDTVVIMTSNEYHSIGTIASLQPEKGASKTRE